MRQAFVNSQRCGKHYAFEQHEFFEIVDEIERTLSQFESISNDTVLRLFCRGNSSDFPSDAGGSDTENSTDNEDVFVVYLCVVLHFLVESQLKWS